MSKIVFYVVDKGGIGKEIMLLAYSGAELYRILLARFAKLLSYITCRSREIKNRSNFLHEQASDIIFSPIPPFSTT